MSEGGVILYPTDTIWCIGCDATNEEAVRREYEIKQRSDSKAMLVLVDSPVKVDFYVQDVPEVAWDLIELADKPLTIIYSGARNLAPNLLADDGSVGIRVTSEAFSKRLCQQFRKAIVSTSANVSGQPSPGNFSEISEDIKSAVDYKVGYRQEDKRSLLQRFIIWREKNIKEKRFILILSFLVGIFTAFAALILKVIIHWIQNFLTDNFNATEANYLYLVYPVVGIFLTGLFVRYVVKDDISHGVTKILYAISRRQGRIKRHNTWSSIIASSITIGFGGSVGAEAPIVLTGSAIGSNLGTIIKMEHRTLMLLVGCGAAGAVAGIFKAPIAGLVFTLEVLMIDLTMSSLLPLLISAVTAATVSYIVTGTDAMFKFHLDQAFELERIPYVIMLGIFCGLVSLYFTRAMNSVEGVFGRLRTPYKKLIMGGAMLSILIFLFPPLYGEGYDTIELLLNGMSNAEWDTVMNNSFFYGHGNLLLIYLILIILFKVFASSATNGGGGCGGIFAPSLYLGCIAGFVFSHFSNEIEMTAYLPEKNFALMGMAGVMSGVMHAPLTGVFLIAELTGGYDLFLPLMIVSVSSYLTIIMFEPHSIYSMRLAKKGELLTHHKDKAILTLMKMENVVEKDFVTVHPEMDLGELVKAISASHRNVFPVTDKEGVLIGIVLLDDIRNIMFRQELYHRFTVGKLMTSAPARLYDTDSMEQVMRTIDDTKAWNLPVVDAEKIFLGYWYISRKTEDFLVFTILLFTSYYLPFGVMGHCKSQRRCFVHCKW